MLRRWVGVALASALALAVMPAPQAAAQSGAWSWHLSAGAVSADRLGFTGALWAGSPVFEELFIRAGLTAIGGRTILDGGIVYLLTPVAPNLGARFPNLDPYVAAMLAHESGMGMGLYAAAGGTYRLAPRTWGWSELRFGQGLGIVVGLGFSF